MSLDLNGMPKKKKKNGEVQKKLCEQVQRWLLGQISNYNSSF